MDIEFFSTIIFCENLNQSVEFYKNILGLEVDQDYGRGVSFKNGMSLWKPSLNDNIMKTTNKLENKENHSIEIFFFTNDIQKVSDELTNAGIKLIHDIELEVWGQKAIRFHDPDNHIVGIGEYPEKFIKEQIAKGLSLGEVSRRSGIPIKLIMKLLA